MDKILKSLIDSLNYSQERIAFIRSRLTEIMKENNLTLEELGNYCWADSCTMFGIIFEYADFDRKKFACA
jgi:hypothetical protein